MENKKSPYMDYRNTVPFINLVGYIKKQPNIIEDMPAKSLQEQLLKKRFSTMINLRRFVYCSRVKGFKYGQK